MDAVSEHSFVLLNGSLFFGEKTERKEKWNKSAESYMKMTINIKIYSCRAILFDYIFKSKPQKQQHNNNGMNNVNKNGKKRFRKVSFDFIFRR